MQTGPRIYNLFPLLAGSIKTWADHLPRIAGMGFDWVFVNPFQMPGASGSLYAVRDPRELHPVVRGDAQDPAEVLIRDFMAEAGRHGLSVMMDLVINHTAKDALLTETHPEWYVHNEDGSLHSPFAVDPDDPDNITVWTDLADLNYGDQALRDGQIAYWNELVAHWLSLGCKGFRCDAAYQVPAEVWRPIIEAARRVTPDCLMAAETLGCTREQVHDLEEAGFDLIFNSAKWWDWRQPWLLEQYDGFRTIAPSIAFPESHDTERLVAEIAGGDAAANGGRVEREYRLRYLFTAVFSTGVMSPMGYEYGFAKRLHVVESRPEDWTAEAETPRFDLTGFIAEVNRMRAAQPALNVEGLQVRLTEPENPVIALLRYDAASPEQAKTCVLSLINADPVATETLDPARLTGGIEARLSDIAEVTPDHAAEPFEPGRPITLDPQQIRVYAARTAPR